MLHGGVRRVAHTGGRVFEEDLGHAVRLLLAREVKPFMRLPKTDATGPLLVIALRRRPVHGARSLLRVKPSARDGWAFLAS